MDQSSPGPNDLTVLATAYAWVGVAVGSDDATLGRLITGISNAIQKFLGYNVIQQSYTRSFNGRGGQRLFVPDAGPAAPLTAVSALTINGQTIPAGSMGSGGQTSGYYFDDRSIALIGCYAFWRGFQNITSTYTAGLTAVPNDLEQACLDWLKLVYAGKDPNLNLGLSVMKAGDTELEFANRELVSNPSLIQIPPSILSYLQPYQRVFPIIS